MGLFDTLTGGKKPERRRPTRVEESLVGATEQLETERAGLTGAANLFADSLRAGKRGVRADFVGAGAADVQQQFRGAPTTNAQAVENAIRRGKGLARITSSREREFDEQLLKNRIAFTGATAARRGRGLSALTGAATIAEGVSRAKQQREMSNRAARANLFGTLTGIAGGVIAGGFGGFGGGFGGGGGGGSVKSTGGIKPAKI